MCTYPFLSFTEEHRNYYHTALTKLRVHVQQVLRRQGLFCDVSSWDLLYLKTPKQPDSVSCGVCVLIRPPRAWRHPTC